MHFTGLDIFVVLVLGFFVLRNTWIGFLRGLASLAGLVIGAVVAGQYHSRLTQILAPWIKSDWLGLTAYLVTFLLVFLAVFILIELLRRLVHSLQLSWIDRLLGFFLGLAKGVILLWLAFMLLATFFPQSERVFRKSVTYPYIASGARYLITMCPPSWRARFNYNLRHFFEKHR